LKAPELQVATESNVVSVVNSHYNVIFSSIPPTVKPGRDLDNFLNLAGYQSASATQLTVPQYGVDKGYFSANTFDPAAAGTQPGDVYNQKDNLVVNWDALVNIYTNAYTASLTAQYAPVAIPAIPGTTQKQVAHGEAVKATMDQCDLLLTGGYLKAKFGSLSTMNPRKTIIDEVSLIVASNRHTTDPVNFRNDAINRCRNLVFLTITTPQGMVLK
jgi:hypothetical protein